MLFPHYVITSHMAESETEFLDYFPDGWDEDIHDPEYVEWRLSDDPTILVRLDGSMGPNDYSVTPVTGINASGEEFVTRPLYQLSKEEAGDIASAMIYALNGAIGRVRGEAEFTGDDE